MEKCICVQNNANLKSVLVVRLHAEPNLNSTALREVHIGALATNSVDAAMGRMGIQEGGS